MSRRAGLFPRGSGDCLLDPGAGVFGVGGAGEKRESGYGLGGRGFGIAENLFRGGGVEEAVGYLFGTSPVVNFPTPPSRMVGAKKGWATPRRPASR